MTEINFSKSALDGSDTEQFSIAPGVNLRDWLEENGFIELMYKQPIIVLLNGEELMEKDYDLILKEDDKVAICAQQEGIEIVTLVVAVVSVVAAVALYLTMPTPQNPNSVDSDQASPTYSINARGNFARVGQPKPVLYGRMRVYPDLSSKPYTEFDANGDQYAYQIFEVTQGRIETDVSTWRFEDTNLNSFSNFEYEIIPPGQKSNLFPAVVDVSSELENAELESVLGPYSANEPATETTRIAVDVVLTGLYYQTDRGGLANHSVSFRTEVREIDDNGNAIGGWVVVGNHTLSGASRDAIRRTYEYSVSPGRYEVQMIRTSPTQTSIRYADKINWSQLRAYIGDTSLTSTTRIALKIRASNQIGNRALSRFNIIAQRLLPTWDSVNGWGSEVATSNPVWAFADACRQNYGGDRSDFYIDLKKCEQFAPIFNSENVEFNGVFDTKTNLWDALTAILMPARCRQVDNRGVYTFVRDDVKSVAVQKFSMRNIVRDSFVIEHAGVLEETSDSIRAKFFDKEQDYREVSFVAALSGSSQNNPREVELFGITDKDQAFKIAQWMNAQNYFRRERIKFETGVEGRIPFYGDLIAICHYMTGVDSGISVVSGDVVSFDSGNSTLELSEPVGHISNPYIVLRELDGAPTEPLTCNIIGSNFVQITDSGFDASQIVFEQGYDRPHFSMGEGTDFMVLAKVEKISIAGPGRVEIQCFVDAPEVYTAADGVSLPPITQLPPMPNVIPTVSGLLFEVAGTEENPEVYLTWKGERSDFYEIEYSIDGGQSFYPAGSGRSNSPVFQHSPGFIGDMVYRVAGVSILRGNWVSVQVDTSTQGPGFSAPGTPTNLALRETFVGPILKLQWLSQTVQHQVEYWRAGILRFTQTVEGNQTDLHGSVAQEYSLQREFEVRVYSISPAGTLSDSYASINVSNPAPASLNNFEVSGFLGVVKIDFDWPNEPDLSGISVWVSDTPGFTPSDSTLVIDRSMDPVIGVPIVQNTTIYIRAAARDVWGAAGLNYSGEYEATASGVDVDLTELENDLASLNQDLGVLADKFPIGETDIQDGAISTPKLLANAVTAEKLTIGNFTNLIPNGNFKTGDLTEYTTGYSQNVSVIPASTAGVPANAPYNHVVRFSPGTANLSSHGTTVTLGAATTGIEVTPGESYQISADVSGSSGAANVTFYLWGTRKDGTTGSMGGLTVSPTTSWQNYSTTVNVPADFVRARMYAFRNNTTGTVYFTNLRCTKRFDGSLIVDGAISAAKLTTNAVTADKIAANAVTAAKISVVNLSAISAAMGDVTSGTFRTTAGTTYRVEISSAGSFPLWIGNGAKTAANALMYIDTSGNMVYRGSINIQSAPSGSRTEYTDQAIKVFDGSTKRVQIGNLSA